MKIQTPKQSSSLEYKLKNDDILYFLHIPKNAGTTFTTILDTFYDHNLIYPEQLWHKLLQNKLDISKFKLIRGHLGYCIHRVLPKKPLYITILRDPIERTISEYEHSIRDPDRRFQNRIINFTGKTVAEILENPKHTIYQNPQTRHIGTDPDITSFINTSNSDSIAKFEFAKALRETAESISDVELIRRAKQNLSEFAFVGIAEKFEESLFLLYYTFGWRPMPSLWKLNVSPKRTKTSVLPSKALQKILDATQLDKKLYEYGVKLFEERYSKMVENLKAKYYEPSFANLPLREMMYKMLEKHYESCLHESHIKPAKSIDYDFRQKLSGTGWYWREILEENGNAFRWTGPETTSTIDFAVSKKEDLIIQFRVMRAISSDLLDSLSLKVNEHPIEIKILESKTGSKVFEGFIPKSALSNKKDFVRISFEINRTINPHEINPLDPTDRPLGIAMDRIKIMPAKEYDKTQDQISIEGSSFFSKKNFQWKARLAVLRVGEKFKSSQKH